MHDQRRGEGVRELLSLLNRGPVYASVTELLKVNAITVKAYIVLVSWCLRDVLCLCLAQPAGCLSTCLVCASEQSLTRATCATTVIPEMQLLRVRAWHVTLAYGATQGENT